MSELLEIDIYTVVHFGCDSSPSDMWVPTTRVFTDEKQAYEYYHSICPAYDPDDDDEDDDEDDGFFSTRKWCDKADKHNLDNGECIMQLSGYHDSIPNRAKRPEGALITVEKIKIPLPPSK